MSYEGYTQYICENGHAFYGDSWHEQSWCPNCSKAAVWENSVDTTNGSYDEKGTQIDGYITLEELTPPEYCKCDKCSNEHRIKEPTYKIPEKGGHKIDQNKSNETSESCE